MHLLHGPRRSDQDVGQVEEARPRPSPDRDDRARRSRPRSADVLCRRGHFQPLLPRLDRHRCGRQAHYHASGREEGGSVENESMEQIAFADTVLLNKIDLVEDRGDLDVIRTHILAINHGVEIIETRQSEVDPKRLLNRQSFDLKRVLETDPAFLTESDHMHDQTVTSVGFTFEYDLILNELESQIMLMLREKGTDLFRYKGIIPIKGKEQRYVFHGVHMLFGGAFSSKWEQNEPRVGRFIFIGKNLDREQLTKSFEACRAGELRFKVGDKVRVSVKRGFAPGDVLKTWDDGNAYQVELISTGVTVWAPVDDEGYIRSRRRRRST